VHHATTTPRHPHSFPTRRSSDLAVRVTLNPKNITDRSVIKSVLVDHATIINNPIRNIRLIEIVQKLAQQHSLGALNVLNIIEHRSEERRVGNACRTQEWPSE